jgi:hypothetical protein
LLPLVNSARVRLLDDAELLRELRGLERRRGATRDRVDHRPGAHDDRAIAVTVALVQASERGTLGPLDKHIMRLNLNSPPTGSATERSIFGGCGPSTSLERQAFGRRDPTRKSDFDFYGN